MILIGRRNRLKVLRAAPPGYYLDGGDSGEILLPGVYIPHGSGPGDLLDVFVYRESEDRLVSTTEQPRAMVGECAFLEVVSVNPRVGVFLDWGLPKDLLLPIREQKVGLKPHDHVVVAVYLDRKTNRIVASTRLNRHVDQIPPDYSPGQAVPLLITGESPLGVNAIVNHRHVGLLYHSDLAAPLEVGETLTGYIRSVRPDGKIDLGLEPSGRERVVLNTERILEALKAAGGSLPLHDNSSPDEIRAKLGLSKKAFKQTIGILFKARRIVIAPDGIRLAAVRK